MIMYTMMPQELIFPAKDEDYMKESVIDINGVQLIVQPYSPHQWKIVRLLSSNPSDFLDEKFQPGQIINMNPSIL